MTTDRNVHADHRLGVPSPEAIRKALNDILASSLFTGSARYTRFLRFVVEETLGNRGDGLKEYLLAVRVFNRKETFDSHLDPIVRVEASRLRARLTQYYQSEGRDDSICIEFPKGTYVPTFRVQEKRPVRNDKPRFEKLKLKNSLPSRAIIMAVSANLLVVMLAVTWWSIHTKVSAADRAHPEQEITAIAVLPLVSINDGREVVAFSDGLTDELINALSRVKSLHVVSRTSVFQFKGKLEDVRKIGKELNAGTVLEGSVRLAQNRFRITLQVIDVATGYNRWSDMYEFHTSDVFSTQQEISRTMVKRLLAMTSAGNPNRP